MLRVISHPFEPVVFPDSKILILGSIPSVKSFAEGFFYMHPQNRFWSLLSKIYEDDFNNESISIKKELLQKHQIALYDVIATCSILGSSDSSIKEVIPIDLKRILSKSNIQHIYLNGKKAYSLFRKYFPEYLPNSTYLPSTSPANATYSFDMLYEDWKQIKIPH